MIKVIFIFLITIISFLISINSYAGWVFETIDANFDSGVVNNTSLTLDSSDKAHISYYDFDTESLKYATNRSGVWLTHTIQNGNVRDTDTSIALDSDEKVHISYESKNGDVMYTTNATGTWVSHIVEAEAWSGVAGDISLTIDSNDKIHISYFHAVNFDLKYATNVSGNWTNSVIVNGGPIGAFPAYSTSIAADKDNHIHIGYYDDWDDTIKHITNKTGSWVSSTVDHIGFAAGWGTSIGITLNNVVYISYYNYDSGQIMCANNSAGDWNTAVVGENYFLSSLAIDLNGNAHISYGDLIYATNKSGVWKNENVRSWYGAGRSAIDTDSNNKPHVSYYGAASRTLEYAYEKDFPWVLFYPAFTGKK